MSSFCKSTNRDDRASPGIKSVTHFDLTTNRRCHKSTSGWLILSAQLLLLSDKGVPPAARKGWVSGGRCSLRLHLPPLTQHKSRRLLCLLRRHPYPAIQANNFAIQHLILNNMLCQSRVLSRPTQARRERHLLTQRKAGRL